MTIFNKIFKMFFQYIMIRMLVFLWQLRSIVAAETVEDNFYVDLFSSRKEIPRLSVYPNDTNWWSYWETDKLDKDITICIPQSKIIPCQAASQTLLSVENVTSKFVLSCTTRTKEIDCAGNIGTKFNYTVLNYESIIFTSLFPQSHLKLLYEIVQTYKIKEKITFISSEETRNSFKELPNLGNDSVVAIQSHKFKLKKISDFQNATVCFSSKTSLHYRTFFYYAYTNLLFPSLKQKKVETWFIENEIFEVSSLLKAACLPGKWSHLDDEDQYFKLMFSNLCALCPNNSCSEAGRYEGPVGAVHCLIEQDADVAFTSWLPVAKAIDDGEFFSGIDTVDLEEEKLDNFKDILETNKTSVISRIYAPQMNDESSVFGLGKRSKRSSSSEFKLLGPNFRVYDFYQVEKGRWLLKPIGGIVGDTSKDTIDEHLNEWRKYSEDTLKVVLNLHINKNIMLRNAYSSLQSYIHKNTMYNNVMRLEPSEGVLNKYFFVVTSKQIEECRSYFEDRAIAVNGQKIFVCVSGENTEGVLKFLQHNTSSFSVIDFNDAVQFVFNTSYEFRVIAVENLGNEDMMSAAVIRKDSYYTNFEQLRGARSCHAHRLSEVSYIAPIMFLAQKKVLRMPECPEPTFAKSLNDFFGNGSCVPGILEKENEYKWKKNKFNLRSLCSQCIGSCSGDVSEPFSSVYGALRCLESRKGDVAFIPPGVIYKIGDMVQLRSWWGNNTGENFEVLCASNNRIKLSDFRQTCAIYVKIKRMVIIPNFNTPEIEKMAVEVFETLENLFDGTHRVYTSINIGEMSYIFSSSADQIVRVPMSFEEAKERIYNQKNMNTFHNQCVKKQAAKHVEVC